MNDYRYYHYKRRGFNFDGFTITKREIIASISIIAVMLLIGVLISSKISEHQMDKNEVYNKAVKIEDDELFQYGMDTNVGNAFVYGDLEAVDTVSYPEIGEEYLYVEKVEEWYERHEEWVTYEDEDGNEYQELEVWYEWDVQNRESKHSEEISFCGVKFPYYKINMNSLSSNYIETINGERTYSWYSGEFVKVRYRYYGISTKHTGTIFTDLRDKTISDNTRFYKDMTIDETVERLESGGGVVIFWIIWIILIGLCVFGFYYIDNRWLE